MSVSTSLFEPYDSFSLNHSSFFRTYSTVIGNAEYCPGGIQFISNKYGSIIDSTDPTIYVISPNTIDHTHCYLLTSDGLYEQTLYINVIMSMGTIVKNETEYIIPSKSIRLIKLNPSVSKHIQFSATNPNVKLVPLITEDISQETSFLLFPAKLHKGVLIGHVNTVPCTFHDYYDCNCMSCRLRYFSTVNKIPQVNGVTIEKHYNVFRWKLNTRIMDSIHPESGMFIIDSHTTRRKSSSWVLNNAVNQKIDEGIVTWNMRSLLYANENSLFVNRIEKSSTRVFLVVKQRRYKVCDLMIERLKTTKTEKPNEVDETTKCMEPTDLSDNVTNDCSIGDILNDFEVDECDSSYDLDASFDISCDELQKILPIPKIPPIPDPSWIKKKMYVRI